MGTLLKASRNAAALAMQDMQFPDQEMTTPHSTFTLARKDPQGRRIPQAIAHRGYKDAFPENTMGAFRGAVEVGAHAIETDVHLSKDGVVVLSHDADLKRCFGREDKVIDSEWSFLKTLQTLKEPHQSMPRLKDLLAFLATPGQEDIWILLDIKLDNNADDVMRLIASTIADVKPSRPWDQRVLLGIWAGKYLPLSAKYLPSFPITYIGFSIPYARQFLKVPNVSFNMLQQIMRGPMGRRFQRDCQAQNRALFLWTVNEERWMRWSIRRQVDGVVTDDPRKYLEVCKDYDAHAPSEGFHLKDMTDWLFMTILATVFTVVFGIRHGFRNDARHSARPRKPVGEKLL
ncbi:MAG: hypothetical protein M1818_004205 [Claussenomyces sp. TS43310]|nr:MAG: hypothetical protein M1818_004205 [Claussenomyces sp. TS43310]